MLDRLVHESQPRLDLAARPSRAYRGVMFPVTDDIRPDLIDTMMDLYCEWRTECKQVHATYERFSLASRADRAAAYAAYAAALDREESACRDYAAHIGEITGRLRLSELERERRGSRRCARDRVDATGELR
jgi:hypothetical protein